MNKALSRALWLPLMVVVLSANYCKDEGLDVDAPITQPFATQLDTLEDRWQSDCIENNSTTEDTIGENGFYNETLEFVGSTLTQTYTYYQDANCSFPVENQLVTDEEAVNTNPTNNEDPFVEIDPPATEEEQPAEEDTFVASISRIMDATIADGSTPTDLGRAYHIDLNTTSIAINDEPLTDEQLLDFGIEVDPDPEATVLEAFIGIFLISNSDQLHLALIQKADPAIVGNESPRPSDISLATIYTRIGTD